MLVPDEATKIGRLIATAACGAPLAICHKNRRLCRPCASTVPAFYERKIHASAMLARNAATVANRSPLACPVAHLRGCPTADPSV